jgi:hypothetical protein
MFPPCTLPEKFAVSGVIRTVMVSWWAGRVMASSVKMKNREDVA